MDALYATGYDGPLSLEIFNDEFRRSDAEMVARDGHRSLINLMDDLRRRSDRPLPSLPVLPDRVEVSCVQYVELACKPRDMSLGLQASSTYWTQDTSTRSGSTGNDGRGRSERRRRSSIRLIRDRCPSRATISASLRRNSSLKISSDNGPSYPVA